MVAQAAAHDLHQVANGKRPAPLPAGNGGWEQRSAWGRHPGDWRPTWGEEEAGGGEEVGGW